MKTIVLKITGMKCGGCVTTAKEVLSKVKGVSSVEIDLTEGKAVVKADETVTPSLLVDAVNKNTNYRASNQPDEP
jgi:copper chaperone